MFHFKFDIFFYYSCLLLISLSCSASTSPFSSYRHFFPSSPYSAVHLHHILLLFLPVLLLLFVDRLFLYLFTPPLFPWPHFSSCLSLSCWCSFLQPTTSPIFLLFLLSSCFTCSTAPKIVFLSLGKAQSVAWRPPNDIDKFWRWFPLNC